MELEQLSKENRLNTNIGSMIFVFGSNEAGYHGAGAARFAQQNLGAIWGVSFGPTGRCFAIPTKNERLKTLRLDQIKLYVNNFNKYATTSNELFQVTQIGCGLAGLDPQDIANMFFNSPENCYFDLAWHPYLPERAKFWGTG
jgi:hypothetical protein